MTALHSAYGAMTRKKEEHISPYLRRPLRPFEEAQRDQAQGDKRPDRSKAATKSVTRDPVDKASPDDPDDH